MWDFQRIFIFLLFFAHRTYQEKFFLANDTIDSVFISDEQPSVIAISMKSAIIHQKTNLQKCFATRSNLTSIAIEKFNNLVSDWTHTKIPELNHGQFEQINRVLATGSRVSEIG